MTIFAIDDEPKALRLLHDAIAEAEPNAEIVDYSDGEAALTAIRSQALTPDVVFSDIDSKSSRQRRGSSLSPAFPNMLRMRSVSMRAAIS